MSGPFGDGPPDKRSAEWAQVSRGGEQLSHSSWSTQQLAEFLAALSALQSEGELIDLGVERVAETLDADVGALVRGPSLVAVYGLTRGDQIPDDAFVAVAERRRDEIELPQLGAIKAISAPLGDDGRLALVLAGGEVGRFDVEDLVLLESMARVMAMGLRSLRLIANERTLRSLSEAHAADNARLLGEVRERQVLLERLAALQSSIIGRHATGEVLDSVVAGVAELIGADAASIRLVDSDDPGRTTIVSASGAEAVILAERRAGRLAEGLGSVAIREGRLLATAEVEPWNLEPDFAANGLRCALFAPIRRGEELVGCLGVACRDPAPGWGQREEQVLASFAEHVTLALNHAAALDEAAHEAYHDSLTGLANRMLLLETLGRALARAERTGSTVAVLVADIDSFANVNDSLGHEAGDDLLRAVATRVREALRPADSVARLGSDDFAILIEDLEDPTEAARFAQEVLDALDAPVRIADREITLQFSVGIATSGEAPADMLRNAEVALHRAKARGRGHYEVFEPEMHRTLVDRLDLEAELRRSIDRGDVQLHYQPVFRLAGGEIAGMEALARWSHPQRGPIAPDIFIPLAEETGLILPLGALVLHSACRQAALWRARYPAHTDLKIAVNLSAAQLRERGLAAEVESALREAQLEPSAVVFEITESVLMEDTEESVRRLEDLKAIGVDLAVDDFGVGYSSLQYLRRFPLDVMKIDRSFVQGLGGSDGADQLVRAMVDLAAIFGLRVVAEGIEHYEQRPMLLKLGCELGQGFEFCRPLPVAEADSFLFGAGLLGEDASHSPSAEVAADHSLGKDHGHGIEQVRGIGEEQSRDDR